ncbi:MAG: amidophosphoribosyltransferase [Cardiobacteriaceae bacterium]|nr:amidophosphoribosyltransferase [Cardiobacteriaceae bacterium]
MCGIVGVVGREPVNQGIYDALLSLQHRGQDAAGIATSSGGRVMIEKGNGLVRDIFKQSHMEQLQGNIGIGHVRYPTAGTSSCHEAQPLYVNSPYGIALAHNGNLTNTPDLMREIRDVDLRHVNTQSDSEVLLNIFAHELQQEVQKQGRLQLNAEMIYHAVSRVHQRVRGAYAVVCLLSGYGLVAFRDPNGIRPLIYGVRETELGKEYMVASESVALIAQGYEIIADILPAETLIITEQGVVQSALCAENTRRMPCIFEYVYFARPDSIIDGISVYKARKRMGEMLARKILREWSDHDIDVVIPIPDTSRQSALELAEVLGVKFREGFIKNRYIGRTFIMPGQTLRAKSVRQKLNPLTHEFRRKNVLLVDDSIVRGTTSQQIIQMARDSGANKVYLASAAPAVRYPNVYGIDMPTREELVAYQREESEIAALIGADKVIYQSLEDLIQSCVQTKYRLTETFDCSVFDGIYPTGDIDEAYLQQLSKARC